MVIRILKTLGIIIIVGIGLVVILILLFWGIISYGNYSKKREAIAYQKEVCDTIQTVDGGFKVYPTGFKPNEIKTITFQLVRNGKLHQEKSVHITPAMIKKEERITIPFVSFHKNDTIAVAINKRYYLLNGIAFTARHNWGMTGPVGPCFCENNGFVRLNGKAVNTYENQLQKKEGITNFKLLDH